MGMELNIAVIIEATFEIIDRKQGMKKRMAIK